MVYLRFAKNKKVRFAVQLLACATVAYAVGSASTTSPFYGDLNVIDEGQFAAWANFMLHGQQMFKDMYIVYGPLFVYPVYLLFKLLSPSAFLVRSYLVVGSIVGIIALNFMMRELKLSTLARYLLNALVILLPIMLLRQGIGWICLLFMVLMSRKNAPPYSLVTGACAALAFFVSPDIGIIVGTLLGVAFLAQAWRGTSLTNLLKSVGYVALGYTLPTAVVVAWAHHEGWLSAYVASTIRQLHDFSGMNVPNGQGLPNIFAMMPLSSQPLAWVKALWSKDLLLYYVLLLHVTILVYLTSKFILRTTSQNDYAVLLILLYGFWLLTISLRTPDIGHLFFTLSPIVVLCVYYTDKATRIVTSQALSLSAKLPYAVVAAVLLLGCARLLYLNHPQILKIANVPAAIMRQPMNPKYVGPVHISDAQRRYFADLQSFMDRSSVPSDKLFIFTDEPMLYLIVDRDNATKYVLPFAAMTKPMRDDLVHDLQTNRPRYILINPNAWSIDGIPNERRLPEVIAYIHRTYTRAQVVDGVIIYMRKSL